MEEDEAAKIVAAARQSPAISFRVGFMGVQCEHKLSRRQIPRVGLTIRDLCTAALSGPCSGDGSH